jgi:uncharacterized membrane protein YozB (DUF420 family)
MIGMITISDLTVSKLPALNACLNTTSVVLLALGFAFIKRKNVPAHRACMVGAFASSCLFLASYLVYHAHAGSVRFTGTGPVRTFYFAILLTHTVLAAAVPFLAVATLVRAVQGRFAAHVKLARVALPIWLYVSVTGVMIYLMLYQLYPPGRATP